MSPAQLSKRIDTVASDGLLVKVTRRRGWDRLDGSIVSRSSKWLLLAIEYDAGFNGHALVRVSDVRRIQQYPKSSFVERALDREGHWPLPPLEGVDLSSTRTALESLAASGLLVAIHYEQDHPNECLIGVPRAFEGKRFKLQSAPTPSGTRRTRFTATNRLAASTSETPTSDDSRPSPDLHQGDDRSARAACQADCHAERRSTTVVPSTRAGPPAGRHDRAPP